MPAVKKTNYIGRPRLNPYAKYATAAYNVAKGAYRGYRLWTKINQAFKPAQTENITTNQYDVVNQYKKKYMPKGKKRQWKRLKRQVHAVAQDQKATRSVCINSGIELGPGDQQAYGSIHLYGGSGNNDVSSNETGCRDLLRIGASDAEIYNGGTAAKVLFKSACMDITMTNTSTKTMEVDLYKIVYGYNERDIPDLNEAIILGQQYSGALNATEANLGQRGVTPFSLGGFINAAKVKILTKRKFLIGANQSSTFQHREPGNKMVDFQDITDSGEQGVIVNDFTYKKLTVSFLFIAKFTDTTGQNTGTLKVRATRSYNYKIEPKIMNLHYNEYITY